MRDDVASTASAAALAHGGSRLSNVLRRLPAMTQRSFGLTAAFWIGFMAGLGSLWEYDTWWHLAGGRLLTETGTIPHTDVFSFTAAGREWIMHEWAWDLLLYSVYSWLGPAGATALKALVSGLIAMAMLHLATRRGASTLVALAAVCLGCRQGPGSTIAPRYCSLCFSSSPCT